MSAKDYVDMLDKEIQEIDDELGSPNFQEIKCSYRDVLLARKRIFQVSKELFIEYLAGIRIDKRSKNEGRI